MTLHKNQHGKYFGLKPLEENIVRVLDGEQMNVTELARIINVPTTTLDYLLPNLKDRGWITSKFVGKRRVWSRENREVHLEQLNQSLKALFADESRFGLRQKDCDTIRLYEGSSEFKKLYARLFQCKHIRAMQSKDSARLSKEKMSLGHYTKLNQQIRKNKMQVDAVVPNGFYKELGKEYGASWLKSFEGRTANTNFIAQDFFDHNVDIISVSGRVVLVNWFDDIALEMSDTTFAPLFTSLFMLVQAGGKKINLTEHVRELQKNNI